MVCPHLLGTWWPLVITVPRAMATMVLLRHLSCWDQPWGCVGSPRGRLGPCQGLKFNNTPAPGMLQCCPRQQGWSPAGTLGLKP